MNTQDAIENMVAVETIRQLSFLYSRACDRLDRALLEQVYWPDGSDDHGGFKGTAPEYIDWVMAFLQNWTSTQHNNCNFLIEVDGNQATGELHWTGFYRYEIDGVPHDQLSAGRYLDQYQKRFGEWRIYHRTCTSEWTRSMPVEVDWRATPGPAIIGTRDSDDPLYQLQRRGRLLRQ